MLYLCQMEVQSPPQTQVTSAAWSPSCDPNDALDCQECINFEDTYCKGSEASRHGLSLDNHPHRNQQCDEQESPVRLGGDTPLGGKLNV